MKRDVELPRDMPSANPSYDDTRGIWTEPPPPVLWYYRRESTTKWDQIAGGIGATILCFAILMLGYFR